MLSRSGAVALLLAALISLFLGSSSAITPWGPSGADVRPGGTLRLRGGQAQLAAYMLCRMGGNDSPSIDDVKKTLESVGAKVEEDKITKIIEDLGGKDLEAINELIAEGKKKHEEVNGEYDHVMGGGGGGGGGGGAGGGAGRGDAGGGAAKEEATEAAKEESASDFSGGDDMGFGLFD